MAFTEQDIITMHAELEAIRERVHNLILVRERVVFHKLDKCSISER